jgi:lyso-ornithine lipid O-acyltransferase
MAAAARAGWRVLRLFLIVWWGIWLTLRHGSGPDANERLPRIRQHWYRRALEVAGVDVRWRGSQARGAALVVANHVSWLDIPVLGSHLDVRFLSKSEVARWPLIGWLARRHGTLFIQRGAHEVETLIRDIADVLEQDQRVAIFPEATTTRGDEVRHFHPRLFAAAIATGTPIQPVAIDYGREPEGGPPQASSTGGDSLLPHAWRLLGRKRTVVELHILPPLEVDPDMARRDLAERTRRAIVAELSLPREAGDDDAAEDLD